MQLAVTELGKNVEVVKILLEGTAKKRLEDLGFSLGRVITPLTDSGGNLIVKIGECRVAINRGVAMRILVEFADKKCGRTESLCDARQAESGGEIFDAGDGTPCGNCFAAN